MKEKKKGKDQSPPFPRYLAAPDQRGTGGNELITTLLRLLSFVTTYDDRTSWQ
jgi:hypothetical protein